MTLDISPLLDHRARLLGYIRTKVQDPTLAEEVLQDSLLKALRAAPTLDNEDRLLPWFYRILNNTITDLYRRRGIVTRHTLPYEEADLPAADDADATTLCACFIDLLPTLKPEYAEVLQWVDLDDGDPDAVARDLGITPTNLKVRRHRARQALKARLEASCRVCATHGCLDCTCTPGTVTENEDVRL